MNRTQRLLNHLCINPVSSDSSDITVCDNWISGKAVTPSTKDYLEVTTPHTGAVIGKVCSSGPVDVDLAVKSAEAAFPQWSSMGVKNRIQILLKLHATLRDNRETIADLIVKEHGKTKAEALGDIDKGNETMEYACSMPQLLAGRILEVSSGVECKDIRVPRGVVASIAPFNFPAMVPLWTLPIAIATGNTMVIKPSEKVPLTMRYIVKLFKEAGLPDGVVNLVNGGVPTVNAICDHPNIKAVTFVGSTRIAEIVSHRCRLKNKPCIALGGAKNYLVAVPDCHLTMTARDVARSAFGCAGERCMAASVLLVVGDQKKLIDLVVENAKTLTPGSGSGNMGPVIDLAAQQRIHGYIAKAEKGGAKLLLDGRPWTGKANNGKGWWVGPTIILHNNEQDCHLSEEIFGPVLSILCVPTRERALELQKKVMYGNAACIYTSSGECAQWFVNNCGAAMCGVNIGVPVPREPFSFGGIKASKFGDGDITGDGGMEFFTERKKVTTKWTPTTGKGNWMS